MNEVINVIQTRRSVRKYKQEMPSQEEIDQVIEAGLYAASGMGKQDVILLCVKDKELRDRLAESNRQIAGMPEGTDPFYGAPVVVIALADKNWLTYLQDGCLAIGNMMLAAKSIGLGSCWIHRAKEEFESEEYKKILKDLGIEGEYEGIGHCIIGYSDEENKPGAERKPGRVYYI